MDDLDKMATEFLRQNDEHASKKNRKSLLEYSYLSERQLYIRFCKEIPFSCMTNGQKRRCPKVGEAPTYDE